MVQFIIIFFNMRSAKTPAASVTERVPNGSMSIGSSPHLGPVVAGGVGKDVAIAVESAGGDGLVQLLRRLQLGARVFVPEAESAVRAHGGQCAVDRVEGDGVHLRPREVRY